MLSNQLFSFQQLKKPDKDSINVKNFVLRNQLASKDQELLALRDQVRKVEREAGVAPAKMEEMEAELKELRGFRDEVRRFMARSDQ